MSASNFGILLISKLLAEIVENRTGGENLEPKIVSTANYDKHLLKLMDVRQIIKEERVTILGTTPLKTFFGLWPGCFTQKSMTHTVE